MTESKIIKLTIILSATFYISSLTQTAYCTTDCKSSLMVLLVGLLGIFKEMGEITNFIMDKINGHESSISNELGATFTWLANPLIIFSLIIFQRSKRTALTLSIISTILILSFMAFDKVIADEAGHYNKVTELNLGYWLWLFSSVIILIGSSTIMKIQKTEEENKNAQNKG